MKHILKERMAALLLAVLMLVSLLPAGALAAPALEWGFTFYGPSTKAESNGFEGSFDSGSVTVYSEGGRGKIVPASVDGLAFYYTAIPTEYNFTLKATVTVDSWKYSNGQEGFGLLVTDRLGESGNSANFWNNQIMAGTTKIEYRYDADNEITYPTTGPDSATKYTMKLGLGVISKTGVTPENLPRLEANDTAALQNEFKSQIETLEWAAGTWGKEKGTYNIVGNETSGKILDTNLEKDMKTTFILEIQKNNTGYFVTYYDADGKTVLCQRKYYGTDVLNQLDKDYVYAGFFAARNARATFTDLSLTTILASEDAPAEEKPVTKIEPTLSFGSATVATNGEYTLYISTNVAGTVTATMDGQTLLENAPIAGLVPLRHVLQLKAFGENRIQVAFTPDPEQELPPDTVLSSTNTVYNEITVLWNKGNYHRMTVYVAPDPIGLPNGNGSKEHPYDIQTAVNNAVPGQTIVLMEGTYKLRAALRIQRGMDGTADSPIRMIADPEAKSRPVLDFQQLSAGIIHGGDHWYFAGFDVTRSAPREKGFQVSGDHNVLDQIHTYENGNTGIQISRYSGSDLFADWPAYNLILNCTSYSNSDPGEEDADGFAAKLTVGEGNVFDGCVAYNNADDGWDLYAKLETGAIGAVTIRNCVAYRNGIRADGTVGAGNGNGFKLGGEGIPGRHVLENSYAFENKAKGIDSNSCPDIIIRNCVSYNNGSYNVALYTKNRGETDFEASGIISFRDSQSSYEDEDNLKGLGTQVTEKYINATTYYWDGNFCVNSDGDKVTAEAFQSLTFQGVARKADGSIDMQGFLEPSDAAPENTNTQLGGQPSRDMTSLPADLPCSFGSEWVTLDKLIHYHECECGNKSDISQHSLEWIIDKEPTPTQTGLKHEQCTVCGYKKAAITTYYEDPNPTEPPVSSAPAGTEPTATQPGAAQPQPDGPSGVLIAVIVVVTLSGFAAIWLLVIKKKK